MALNPSLNSHRIEMCLLAILHVSAWACLIRSDYNFVLVSFAYFVFVSSREYFVTNVIYYLTIALIVLDIIFFIFVPKAWMTHDDTNTLWNGLRGLHGFGIFCSVIILALKAPLLYLLYNYRLETKNPSILN